MKKLLTFAIAWLVLTATAMAQGYTVKGTVVDEDESPLPFAALSLGKAVARTDTNGCFILTNVKAGKDSIIISFPGFNECHTQVDIQGDTTLPALEIYPIYPYQRADSKHLRVIYSTMGERPLKKGKKDGIIIIKDSPWGYCSMTKIQNGRLTYKCANLIYKRHKYKYKLIESACYQLTPEERDTVNRLMEEIKQRPLKKSMHSVVLIDGPRYTVELRDGDRYQCESNFGITDAMKELYDFTISVLERHNGSQNRFERRHTAANDSD